VRGVKGWKGERANWRYLWVEWMSEGAKERRSEGRGFVRGVNEW
jgi:hypothetical protein